MAVSYGANVYFDKMRLALVTELGAMKTQMATDAVSPTFAEIVDGHMSKADWSFNALSFGISTVDMTFPFAKGNPAGRVISYFFEVDIRVMIGYTNVYHDHVVVSQLCQSVVNWLESHPRIDDATYPDVYQIFETGNVDLRAVFDDTETIGGLLTYRIRADEQYTTL